MSSSPAGTPVSPRILKGINVVGLKTFIFKETSRFLNVYTQTLIAPLVTLFLFLVIFVLSLGGGGREILGVPYINFLAPGLLMMTMIQNAFSNTSSSIMISKIQGNIVDVLMPPLSSGEILAGYLIGSLLRGLIIGLLGIAAFFLILHIQIHSLWMVIVYAVLGNLMLGTLGVIGGLWSEKFDHLAAVTNFIITPMTFLSGTFYSFDALPELWRKIALFNPFFYMIDGFRAGFTGVVEADIHIGIILLTCLNAVLVAVTWQMLNSGYKIKS
jgi:ABC-2 type transport system permease protein